MSDADRVSLAYVEETTYGEVPSGPPDLTEIRFTSESLVQNANAVVSRQIRDDRQVKTARRTGISVSGTIEAELSYGDFDDFLLAALMAASWVSAVTVGPAITISASSVDNSFNDSGNGFGSLVANQWIKVTGFTETANNGYFKIVSQTAAKIVVSGGTLTTESAGDSVTIKQGLYAVNGTTKTSFAIEKHYTDLTTFFEVFTGLMVDSLSYRKTPQEIISLSVSFIGQEKEKNAATVGDGANTAASDNEVFNATDDVVKILEGGSSLDVAGADFTLANNLRARLNCRDVGPSSIGTGKCLVSGTFQKYLEDATLVSKFLDETASSLAIVLEDPDGNGLVIDFPRIYYHASADTVTGESSDVMVNMEFTAYMHETEDVTVRIAKFPAA